MEELKVIGTYQEFRKALDKELHNQAEGFVRTGYLLKVARDTDILRESGYKSVAEFAQAEYGLTKDVVSRYISINDRYSEDGYSERLQAKYQGYGVAKLQDMLTLPDAIIEIMSPELTRKEIQEVKREYKEEETNPMASLMEIPIPEQTNMTMLQQAIHQYLYDNRTDFVKGFDTAMRTETEKEDAVNGILDSFAPSGVGIKNVRIQGIGRVMISFRGKDSEVEVLAVRTQERTSYAWENLISELRDVFAMAAGESGVEAWERIYGEQYETEKEKIAPVQPAAEQKVPEPKKPETLTQKNKSITRKANSVTQEPERIAPEDVEIVENTKCETDFEESGTGLAENETETVENDTEKAMKAAEMQNAEQNPGRLTESDDLGNWGVKGLPWKELYAGQTITREIHDKLYGCLHKLMEYEETGLSPEEVERLQEDR